MQYFSSRITCIMIESCIMYKTSGYLRNNIEKTVNGPCI